MKPSAPELTKEYILSEVKKLQYLYGLKYEIRYGQKRPEKDLTESVAEHLYGMNLLAHYFLPLEDSSNKWDRLKILSMIMVHDFDEIETGDTIGYLKTDAEREKEREAMLTVIDKTPQHLQNQFKELIHEYETQMTAEALFVKALDRFEPLIQTYSQFGKEIIQINKTTSEQTNRIKESFTKPFPVMHTYNIVIHQAMIDEGYFDHS